MKFLFKLFFFILLTSTTTLIWAQKRVACIGDSVTKGYGLKDSTKSYPYQLQQLLGERYQVENYGHSGATLLRKGHNPYHKTQAYSDALAFRPDVIIVALGLNDTDPRNWPNYSNDFFADYSQLIRDFKEINPAVEVYICNMTPIFSGHARFLSGTRDWFDQIQGLIPDIARANDAQLIDNHIVLAARIDLFDDNLHPSAQGATILANNIYQYLVPLAHKLSVDEAIGSHMVLQRNTVNSIRGLASANETVKLIFNTKTYTTKADQLGKWTIALPPMKAGGPYSINIFNNKDTVTLEDILFGDVFLASGQSNMAFQLHQMKNSKFYIDNSINNARVRIFKNKNLVETTHVEWDQNTLQKVNDLAYFSGTWEVPNKDNVKYFSAIAYVFANDLNAAMDIPIGIIDLSVGGSNTESWIPRKILEDDNLLATYIHQWRKSDFVQDFCRERGAKNLELATAKYQRHPYDPAYNYEAGVHKWVNTNMKGVLWYQGESNAHNMEHHEYLFEKLVASWRSLFKQELPFYFVQLSSINRPSWGSFRNSQRLMANRIPKAYMAVSSDVGNINDVHPVEKEIIGKRLANLVKQHEYKKKIVANSPQPTTVVSDKGFITITFNNCKHLKLTNGTGIKDLSVMDRFGNIIPIQDSKIIKNKVRIKEPLAGAISIQYGYTAFTEGNLSSNSDVPVATFNLKIN